MQIGSLKKLVVSSAVVVDYQCLPEKNSLKQASHGELHGDASIAHPLLVRHLAVSTRQHATSVFFSLWYVAHDTTNPSQHIIFL
jgi:hypothetical protein